MKLFCVSNIAVHAHPLQVATMPTVRFDLSGGLLTCLYYYITCQEYDVMCIFTKHMLIWYGTCIYLCWMNFVWVWVWVWLWPSHTASRISKVIGFNNGLSLIPNCYLNWCCFFINWNFMNKCTVTKTKLEMVTKSQNWKIFNWKIGKSSWEKIHV